jgi:hypothetical protein
LSISAFKTVFNTYKELYLKNKSIYLNEFYHIMPKRLINNDNAERLINNDNAERLINNDNAERLINNDNAERLINNDNAHNKKN